jgi:hypothetical protein
MFYLYFYRNKFRPILWPSSCESYKILKEVAISTTDKQGAPQKVEEEKHNCNLAPYDMEIIYTF